MLKSSVIAIDGPSGTGKSTLAKLLAKEFHFLYVDTGAMFRAIAYICVREQWPLFTADADHFQQILSEKLLHLDLQYAPSESVLITINGTDVTPFLRTEEIAHVASQLAKFPVVRNFILSAEQKLAQEKTIVMEGRDIGTIVFPQAFCKFFLTAAPEERARRRQSQLEKQTGVKPEFATILAAISQRDKEDVSRTVAPLKPAVDAIVFDTTNFAKEEVIARLKLEVQKKLDRQENQTNDKRN